MSFSLAIANLLKSKAKNILATTLESKRVILSETRANSSRLKIRGATVLHGIDATKLEQTFQRDIFQTIIFQFPNVGSRQPKYGRNPNHHLLKRFLASAKSCLAANGEVVTTIVNRPHHVGAFDIPGAADNAGYQQSEVFGFRPKDFPGYNHTHTNDAESAISRFRSFSTWVFKPQK